MWQAPRHANCTQPAAGSAAATALVCSQVALGITQCSAIYLYLLGVPHVSRRCCIMLEETGPSSGHKAGRGFREGRSVHALCCARWAGRGLRRRPIIEPTQTCLPLSPWQSSPGHNRAWAYLIGQAIALCGTLFMLITGDAM